MDSSTSRVRRYVFDLDGTLFDTKDHVRAAYAAVGVIMPDDAWGQPARAWLPDACGTRDWKWVHELKTKHYLEQLRRWPLERTSAAKAMVELALSGCETYVVTGASREAAGVLLYGFQSYHYRLIGIGCDLAMKITRVKTVGHPSDTIYVDDDIDACEAFEDEGFYVVRYRTDMTKEEVLKPWLERSSSPQDEASA